MALFISVPAAAAEDKVAARQAYIDGSKYYDLNQYAEALEAFKRAYWNYEDAVFLYNIAQCHRALKHKAEAVDFYRSYLRKAPDARNRDDVQKVVSELERAIKKEKAVSTAPPQGTMAAEGSPAPSQATKTAPAAPSPATKSMPATPQPLASAAGTAPSPERTDKPVIAVELLGEAGVQLIRRKRLLPPSEAEGLGDKTHKYRKR